MISTTKILPMLLAGVLCVGTVPTQAASQNWSPRASERLMKLPGNFLKKAVESDFVRSELGAAMTDTDERVGLKKDTLADLQAAIRTAEGDVKTELEHQFLTEKKRYIELMREHQDLRRKRAETKVRLYENMLRKLTAQSRNASPARTVLLANQKAARERLEGSIQSVDARLFRSPVVGESRYSSEYAKNLAAIDSLVRAINQHPMNRAPEVDGRPVSQQEFLRKLIAENEAELAIVDQERAVLGYMAKLVSLDALALSEGIVNGGDSTETPPATDRLTSSLDYFVTR